MKAIISNITCTPEDEIIVGVHYYNGTTHQADENHVIDIADIQANGLTKTAVDAVLAYSTSQEWGMTEADVATSQSNVAPGAGDATKFLRGDGAWASPPGGSEAFPIGSVFISVVSTNPATLLGYGTWSAFGAGRTLVGLDSGDTDFDTVEETGGAKTHTLTTTEMPSHTHTQNAHNHQILRERSATTGAATTQIARTADTSSTVDTNVFTENATATNQNTGGDGAHNNVQPYIVVYLWKRTA